MVGGKKRKRSERSQTDGWAATYRVEGLGALTEYLKHAPTLVQKIVVRERDRVRLTQYLIDRFPDCSSLLTYNSDENSSVVGYVDLACMSFEPWLASAEFGEKNLLLVLDHITDARNFGAIIRSAAFFGIKAVIVAGRRQALLSEAAVGASQGGFALVDIVVCVNITRALDALKQHSFWILGADASGEPMQNFVGRFERQVVVLGAEDRGIAANVKRHCDCLVSIQGSPSRLESLNVSVAAGIIMAQLHP